MLRCSNCGNYGSDSYYPFCSSECELEEVTYKTTPVCDVCGGNGSALTSKHWTECAFCSGTGYLQDDGYDSLTVLGE